MRANGASLNTIAHGAGNYHGGYNTNMLLFDGHTETVNGNELMKTAAADSPWNSPELKVGLVK